VEPAKEIGESGVASDALENLAQAILDKQVPLLVGVRRLVQLLARAEPAVREGEPYVAIRVVESELDGFPDEENESLYAQALVLERNRRLAREAPSLQSALLQIAGKGRLLHLEFALEVIDDWPPVGLECIPAQVRFNGYEVLAPPLFVKNLSVGDVIVTVDGEVGLEGKSELIWLWRHVQKSSHSTIWLARLAQTDEIDGVLVALRNLGCRTVSLSSCGSYAVDVPPSVTFSDADACLATLDPERVAVVFPSLRHPDP
jgi:Domain of unknown function (DUF4265)